MEPTGQKRTMNKKPSIKVEKELVANWQTLRRIFISPENEESRSVLVKYMRQILFGLHEFLNTHVGVTKPERYLQQIQKYCDKR
jgi:glutamate decarboxylase